MSPNKGYDNETYFENSHHGVVYMRSVHCHVRSSRPSECILEFVFTGEAAGDRLGFVVSGAGVVNNDGFADVIVGSFGSDAGGNNAARAYVYPVQTGSATSLLGPARSSQSPPDCCDTIRRRARGSRIVGCPGRPVRPVRGCARHPHRSYWDLNDVTIVAGIP